MLSLQKKITDMRADYREMEHWSRVLRQRFSSANAEFVSTLFRLGKWGYLSGSNERRQSYHSVGKCVDFTHEIFI